MAKVDDTGAFDANGGGVWADGNDNCRCNGKCGCCSGQWYGKWESDVWLGALCCFVNIGAWGTVSKCIGFDVIGGDTHRGAGSDTCRSIFEWWEKDGAVKRRCEYETGSKSISSGDDDSWPGSVSFLIRDCRISNRPRFVPDATKFLANSFQRNWKNEKN